jgi:hypothetical protein
VPSLRAFNTTQIELNAIVPPAIIGFNKIPKDEYKIPAANGMLTEL